MNGRLGAAAGIVLLVLGAISSAAAQPSATQDEPLIIGMTGKYPPFSYFDENGELSGFDVEFTAALCSRLHRRCELRAIEWDSLIGALQSQKVDAVVGSMAITAERSAVVRFSDAYYESGAQLFGQSAALDPSRPGFRIGVTLGTTFEAVARARFPASDVRVYKGDTDALQELLAGRLDALLTDSLVGAYIARKRGAILTPIGSRLIDEKMGIPVHPQRGELLLQINRAIHELRASGVQQELLHRHLGHVGRSVESGLSRALPLLARGLWATISICVVGLGLGIVLAVVLAWVVLARSLLSRPASWLVDFVRATPFMIQLFALYFGSPALGIRIGAMTSAILAIALHSAAYLTEVIKTAYQAVPDGQRSAARALGLTSIETLRHVIWPQMLPLATVPALNTLVAMIKDSSVVSVIGVYELTLQSQRLISATFQPLEYYGIAALLYFVLTFPLLVAGRRLERRWRAQGLLHG